MNERQKVLRTLFLSAVQIEDTKRRAAYLSQACGADLALLRELEDLIQTQGTSGELVSELAGASDAQAGSHVRGSI